MRLLITGITGFVGSHMTELALARGAEVFGSMRWRSKTENIDHLRHRITLVECDLRDLSSVRNLLEIAAPTDVVHLAAQSFVAASWKAPAETLTTNILSQVNLLEAMRDLKIAPRFLAMIIDDTAESITISCFNPVRREVARLAISALVADGRIHPTRIEEVVRKAEKEVEETVREAGQKALFEVGGRYRRNV